MLVEMNESPVGSGSWVFKMSDGAEYATAMVIGVTPMEAEMSGNKVTVKNIIKLKREGFTAEEIAELYEAKVL